MTESTKSTNCALYSLRRDGGVADSYTDKTCGPNRSSGHRRPRAGW
ncbi:hypothetical protein [Streptomyces sp. NPDC088196]